MTELERVERILDELEVPRRKERAPEEGGVRWVLSGSGVMILHGLERSKPMGDLDIFVATRDWFMELDSGGWLLCTPEPDDPRWRSDPPYLIRHMYDLEVDLFQSWRTRHVGDIDVAFWLRNPEWVRGWPCVPLQFLLDWKREVGRAKDVDDIRLLERYLGEAAA